MMGLYANSPVVKGTVICATGLTLIGLRQICKEQGLLRSNEGATALFAYASIIAGWGLAIGGGLKAVGMM